jgi:hypothetical protein
MAYSYQLDPYESMGKRKTAMSSTKVVPHPHKTKKRLAAKKEMLAAKAAKKTKGRSKTQ